MQGDGSADCRCRIRALGCKPPAGSPRTSESLVLPDTKRTFRLSTSLSYGHDILGGLILGQPRNEGLGPRKTDPGRTSELLPGLELLCADLGATFPARLGKPKHSFKPMPPDRVWQSSGLGEECLLGVAFADQFLPFRLQLLSYGLITCFSISALLDSGGEPLHIQAHEQAGAVQERRSCCLGSRRLLKTPLLQE